MRTQIMIILLVDLTCLNAHVYDHGTCNTRISSEHKNTSRPTCTLMDTVDNTAYVDLNLVIMAHVTPILAQLWVLGIVILKMTTLSLHVI